MKPKEIWKPKTYESAKLKDLTGISQKAINSMRVIILKVYENKVSYTYFSKISLKMPQNKLVTTRENFLKKFEKDRDSE